jgi:hypothetical protein
MIELGEVIGELRRELQQAMSADEGEPLRFARARSSWRPPSRWRRAAAVGPRFGSG